MERDPRGECIFKTQPCKKTITPKWNERFQINVHSAEEEVITVRFASDSKSNLKATKNSKTYMGEISFPLRSAARNFDRPNYQFKWYELTEATGGGSGTLGEVKIYIEFIDTKMVSGPTDFKQVSHIGWSADGGFDINNIPPEWKKIFKTVGISKRRLEENPELANQVLDIMNSTPDPSTIAPPPPPQPGKTQQSAPQPTQTQSTPIPPPPPQLSGGGSNFQAAPIVNSGVAPPPPPPPAPIVNPGIAPPPPPPPGGSSGGGGGGLLDQIRQGTTLSSGPSTPKPAPSGGGGLLDQIRQGTTLTRVTETTTAPPPPSGGGGLMGALASALAANRTAVAGDDKEEEWSDADDWSDSD